MKKIFTYLLTASSFLFSALAFAIPKPQEVMGIYVTGEAASNQKKLNYILSMVDVTPLNSIVVDIKEAHGVYKYDLEALVQKCHKKNIYVIARQVVFKDFALARKNPSLRIRSREGSYVSPFSEYAHNYNIEIAKKAVKAGIDEIQFDYIRFPDDYGGNNLEKRNAINKFLKKARKELKAIRPEIKISVDIFGYVAWTPDIGIGQKLEEIAEHVDVICPMAYPSHYSAPHRKWGEYKVVFVTCQKAKERLKKIESKAEIRPWIQGFAWRANFGQDYVLRQIKAARDSESSGWCFWNAASDHHVVFHAVRNLKE